jgi:hypothetical protein
MTTTQVSKFCATCIGLAIAYIYIYIYIYICIRCFFAGKYRIYGRIRRVYTVLANPKYVAECIDDLHAE